MVQFKKIGFALLIMCFVLQLPAQIEEVTTQQRSSFNHLQKVYRYTATAQADTVSVKVINPRGEMQVLPVREAKIAAHSSLDFAFNTKHWIPGMYHVIVNGKQGRYSKRFKILDPREQ